MSNAGAGPSKVPEPATPGTPPKSRRRSWFDFSSPSNSFTATPPRKASNSSSRKESKSQDEEVEMSEAGPSRLRSSITTLAERAPAEEEEILTIDGKVEKDTVKEKKKRKSQGEEEVVRLKELRAPASMGNLKDPARALGYDPGGAQPLTLPKRTFSRSASDRERIQDQLPSTQSENEIDITNTPSPPSFHDSFDATSPDRPLPPLPGATQKTLPDVPLPLPRGIVVTPSSPRKLTKRSNGSSTSSSLTKASDRRSLSAGRSRSSSQTRRAHSAKSSPIGIGLPRSLGSGEEGPPPLPAKVQSVSSPFPSRGNSPTPRIAFTEPEEILREDDGKDAQVKEKKTRLKRARSLSGLLGKPPQVVPKADSRPHTPEPEEEETIVKASGVLGWLGVKKTVKRRQSETKLQVMNGESEPNSAPNPMPLPLRTSDNDREQRKSRESLGLDDENGEGTLRSRRPDLGTNSSSVTVVPNGPQTARGIFGRRSTSRGSQRDVSPRPIPISISSNRQPEASSSQSSLQLPQIEPTSPSYYNVDNWGASPQEGEETLFSPGSGSNWGPGVRPWMDGLEGGRSNRSSFSVASPLESLPEQSIPPLAPQVADPPSNNVAGRLRSYSDAPLLPPPDRLLNSSNPHLPVGSPISQSLQSSPLAPVRPTMPGRSNSGNSAIIGRMRNVFSKTTSRGRSQTLLRQPSSDLDEFGTLRSSNEWPAGVTMRPSSSSSSDFNSPRATAVGSMSDHPQLALLGLSNQDRHIFLNDTPDRSPRTSMTAASISSVASGSIRSIAHEPTTTRGRARASTMSAGPTSYNFVPPSSPHAFPIAATPPRRRPSVIQRLSSGVLRSSGPSSPRSGSLFPLPARSNGSTSSGFTGAVADDTPGSASPRPSAGSLSAATGSAQVKAASVREEGDTPETWLDRVSANVGRNEIANVLASSGEDFVATALKIYMSRFDFTHNALDVALRRLLMHMSLPRETQQIDRVIEAFAVRYEECEPGLFVQKDNTYVLAFSMMMLHTDAFNRHNKNKMAKSDYVRNTRMEGVPSMVLEAFFDNITFTPFVFIEDDSELMRTTLDSATTLGSMTPSFQGTTLSSAKNGKIDVYNMIVRNLLGSLRIDMESDIPAESPFSCIGTRPFLDMESVHRAFASARNLAIVMPKRKNSAAGLLSSTPSKATMPPESETILKVTKVGLLSRKDDSFDVSKKSSRKWKSWSVILTGSQILFFKDPVWALTLLEQSQNSIDQSGRPLLPRMTNFKPDEVFPVKDFIAVHDRNFAEAPYAFRFVMSHGRQYLLQASDEYEMNEWIHLINYASAFKTANIRMRSVSMGKDRAVLAGAAAAASHKREVHEEAALRQSDGTVPRTPRKTIFGESADTPGKSSSSSSRAELDLELDQAGGVAAKRGDVDVDGANDVAVNEGEQLEEVFDVVKAELAAGRGGATRTAIKKVSPAMEESGRKPDVSTRPSRADIIENRIRDFEHKLKVLETHLKGNIRVARNLALLTPFQRSTRDRIASSVPSLAHKIRDNRIEVAKFELWITVLRKDLEAEQRDWAQLRHVALQAAAKSLRDPLGVKSVVQDINAAEDRVPTLALPISEGRDDGGSGNSSDGLSNSPGELPVIIRRPSDEPVRQPLPRQGSIASYRSSTSISSRPELRRSSSDLLSARDAFSRPTSPQESTANSTPMLFPLSDVDEGVTGQQNIVEAGRTGLGINFKSSPVKLPVERVSTEAIGSLDEGGLHEENRRHNGHGGEEAEDWRKTKAAKRVSLAAIPIEVNQRTPSRQVDPDTSVGTDGEDKKGEEGAEGAERERVAEE